MKIRSCLLSKALTVILAGCLLNSSGCIWGQKTEEKPVAAGPVFFPPPPDQPRLQFLVSYSGAEDFGGAKSNFFETFLLGAPKQRPGLISKPYGVAIHKGKIYVCDVGQNNIGFRLRQARRDASADAGCRPRHDCGLSLERNNHARTSEVRPGVRLRCFIQTASSQAPRCGAPA